MVGNLYFFSDSAMKYLKSIKLGYFFNPIIVAIFFTQTPFAQSSPAQTGSQDGSQVPVNPYFMIRSDYKPGELLKAAEVAIDNHKKAVEKILSIPPSEKEFSNTVVALDAALAELSAEVNKIGFMKSVSSVEWMISESMAADMKFNEYLSEYYLNSKVLQSIELSSGNLRTEEQKRLSRSMEWDLRSRGVFLPDNLKKIAQKLGLELDRELLDFSQAINKDRPTLVFTKAELAGMPERILKGFKTREDGAFVIDLSAPAYTDIMTWADNSETRRKTLLAWEQRGGKQNLERLGKIIGLRKKLAQILGYKSWSDFANLNRISGSHAVASKFLLDTARANRTASEKELELLRKVKARITDSNPSQVTVNQWDETYLWNLIKRKYFEYDEEKIREYFPADKVMAKVIELYSTLFQIEFKEIKAPTWHDSVKVYQIKDNRTGEVYSYLYMDLYERKLKRGGATAYQIASSREVNGVRLPAVTAITCNFSNPHGQNPSLLRPDDVTTLLHETGHFLHMALTRAKYASLSGSNVARDFVEVPSQMMEFWMLDPQRVKLFSEHFIRVSETIPENLAKATVAGLEVGKGRFMARQLSLGLVDLSLHSARPPTDINAAALKIYRNRTGIDLVSGSLFPASFGHLNGYSAAYYSYNWALRYNYDLESHFLKEGFMNPETWTRYLDIILSAGDTAAAPELLEKFLGRKPNSRAFNKRLRDTSCIDPLLKLI